MDDEKNEMKHGFDDEKVAEFKEAFDIWDESADKKLQMSELASALAILGNFNTDALNGIVKRSDKNGDGVIDFDEFLAACWDSKSQLRTLANKQIDVIQIKRSGSIVHSYAQEELSAFSDHFNYVLGDDKDLKYLMPIKLEGLDLCKKIRDGVLLAKFINSAVEDTIDMRAVNKRKKGKKLSLFQINENNNLVIEAAKSIGVKVTNIGASDLREGSEKPHLVLGVIWQLVKIQLLAQINLKNHPELLRLLGDDETLDDLLAMPAEKLLLRWFNYHLEQAEHPRRVRNFGKDVCDSECYTVLLNRINPKQCDLSALKMRKQEKRAAKVLDNARKAGCQVIIKPKDIVAANERLNLAFTAAIFNHMPGLEPITEEEQKDLAGMMEDDTGDSREERAFRMWINTLGIKDLYIDNLFQDCKDGLVLLKVLDKIDPGCVSWKRVEKRPKNKFKKISNCNYVVVLGKSLKFSLVATGGSDIVDGNKKLVLGLVWQMMRYNTMQFLSKLSHKGKRLEDKDVLLWANQQVAGVDRSNIEIRAFNDAKLGTGHFFVDLLASVEPDIVDWSIVSDDEDDSLLNARYAISIARKMGCTIFLLPEDIVESRSKMCLTFSAAVMMYALKKKQ